MLSDRKEDIFQYIGRTLFLVLLLFVMVSVTDNSDKPTCHYAQNEVLTGLDSGTVHAFFSDYNQMPVLQKSLLTSIDKIGFLFYNNKFKIAADGRTIAQQIIFLENSYPSVKTLHACRFYYHLFSTDANAFPVLS